MKKYLNLFHILWGLLIAYLIIKLSIYLNVSGYNNVLIGIFCGMIIYLSMFVAFIKITE